MSQRINAARVVVSVNMKSPTTDNPRPSRIQSQMPRQNNPGLRSIREIEKDVEKSNSLTILSPSDRRMSRRKPGNQGIKPLDLLVNQADTLSPMQLIPEIMEAVPSQTRPEIQKPDYSRKTAYDNNRTDVASSPLISASPQQEEDLDEAYSIERPVYLLSQKYFGTRY